MKLTNESKAALKLNDMKRNLNVLFYFLNFTNYL